MNSPFFLPRFRRARQPSRARAFTLAELLVALTVAGLASVGILRFTIQGLNIYHYDAGRIKVNTDIRSFTTEMTTNAVYSNYFKIYPNFTTRNVTESGVTADAWQSAGESGDFLLLVFADTDLTTGKTSVHRLIGYYRTPDNADDPASTGPIRMFDRTISPAVDPTVTPLHQLLDTHAPTSSASANPVVLELAQGLCNGTLFYNFKDRSVMIRGQIIEQGDQRRRAVNTYNFTVSPRG